MGSTRFPGKPLADATGKPMVQHVFEQALAAERIDRVIIATDDDRIMQAVEAFGGTAVMTSPDHPNGTSRIAEVVGRIQCGMIVNVQGDEPMIDPATIDTVVTALERDPEAGMATVACPFGPDEDPEDPNLVKAFVDAQGRAGAFSRTLTPDPSLGPVLPGVPPLRHLGLYAYRPDFLQRFAELPPTPLERSERLEQLRALEHGHPIALKEVAWAHHGIDTPEQYEAFVKSWRSAR
ncbi:MAG: 3-deoxy-manno-octulosonate cytidylyltransferase [Phycisphaerales bacterium]|nr:3-deoxy-manno-octulosonate cytidylyltransferase [Phycisphaerales bacterium]